MPRRNKTTTASTGGLLKWVLICGATILLVTVLAVFLIVAGIKNWLRSDAFRQLAEQKAAEVLKSEVELKSLKWDGKSNVYSDGLDAYGYEDASLSALRAESIRADIGKVTGVLEIPEVKVNRFYLEFSPERRSGLFERSEEGLEAASSSSTVAASAPNWLSSLVPKRAEIGSIRISQAGLRVKDESASDSILLRDVSATLRPMNPEDLKAWDIEGDGGKLLIQNVPPLNLQHFTVRWRESNLFLTEAAAGIYEDGRLTGEGEIGLGEDGSIDLDLKLSGVGVTEILDESWREKVRGQVGGDINVAGTTEDLTQSGTLRLSEGQITAMPVLDTIARYTKMDQFKTLVLHEAKTDFVQTGERIVLSELVMQSDGLCRVEGSAVLDGGLIDGTFRVGVNPGALRWIPGAERKVFLEKQGGFLWTTVKVSGPTASPKEDLSGRLISGAIESLVEDAPGEALDRAKEMLQDSQSSPSSLLEEGKKAVDLLAPLFGN